MKKFEYKRVADFYSAEFKRLGEAGWQLMHVYPPEKDGSGGGYLLMREVTKEEPFRSLFEQVFGSRS